MSPDVSKTSHRVASFLIDKGYDIIPVYPNSSIILGRKSHSSIQDAFIYMENKGIKCDIINVFRKSDMLPFIVNEICLLKGLESFDEERLCVWVQIGLQNNEAAKIAKQNGLIYEENSCIKLEYNRIFQLPA